jgi:PAS domain S-box-containing protein
MLLDERHSSNEISLLQAEQKLLSSHNIHGMAKAVGVEDDGGSVVLAMEFAGSITLGDLVATGGMQIGDFLSNAIKITQTLSHIHDSHIIHCDLSPSNIVIDSDSGTLTIIDFGSATTYARVEQMQVAPIRPGQLDGNLKYIAPEQTGRMKCPVDHRSDLYALGAIFYEMLTGVPPFLYDDPLEMIHAHLSQAPVPPHKLNSNVPKLLSEIVLKLMAKAQDDRYQSASGLAYDLNFLNSQPTELDNQAFKIGRRDRAPGLSMPEKLYGRSAEQKFLTDAFDRMVAANNAEFLLVSGYSGVGKTSLVRNLYEPLVREHGFCLAGKFDQFKRDIPFATIMQAFQELVQYLLTEPEEQIDYWKERLQDELGGSAVLIARLLPQIELILGKQPEMPLLAAAEEQIRFKTVFRQFIKVFAQPQHPLVLFLDDLQWADSDSLQLIKSLIIDGDGLNLLLIGAFRDNEVGTDHSLTQVLAEIRDHDIVVDQIILEPLTKTQLDALVSDTLRSGNAETQPLANLIYEKTHGNPFFAIQFLQMLYLEQLLQFDAKNGSWTWDLAEVKARKYADNIVDLLLTKLARLSESARNLMKVTACLGHVVDLNSLYIVYQNSQEETERAMGEAIKAGLMLLQRGQFKFLHDRIQQAAYGLIPEDQRTFEHLRIGRLLLRHTGADSMEKSLFDIVSQYNLGAALVTSNDEKEELAQLNLRAGRKAKDNTAYTSAIQYFSIGVSLLADSDINEVLFFDLRFAHAECLWLINSLDEAEHRCTELLPSCKTNLDHANVYRLLAEIAATNMEIHLSVEHGLKGLSLLGVHIPLRPTRQDVDLEYDRVWKILGNKTIESLVDLPLLVDRQLLAALDLMQALIFAFMILDRNLFLLVSCKIVNLSLQHGNCNASVLGYAQFALMLPRLFGKYDEARSFSALSRDLTDNRGLDGYKGRMQFLSSLTSFWTDSLKIEQTSLRQALETAKSTSDRTFGDLCSGHSFVNSFIMGTHLGDLQRLGDNIPFLQHSTTEASPLQVINLFRVTNQKLIQPSTNLAEFYAREDEYARRLENNNILLAGLYYVVILQAHFIIGDFEQAVISGRKAEPLLWAHITFAGECEYWFYFALALAAHYEQVSEQSKKEYLKTIKIHEKQLKEWAEQVPDNFQHKHALVSAELARLQGRQLDAQRLYEESIHSAQQSGYIQNEAIANELAGRFYFNHGYKITANAYLKSARSGYVRWGAAGKVAQLDRIYPELHQQENSTWSLDMMTVFKAAQAISQEVVFDKLLETLMRVVIEAAGAQQGILILQQDNELIVRAHGQCLDGGEISSEETKDVSQHNVVIEEVALKNFSQAPMAVINYVRRTLETVVVDEAVDDTLFGKDPYFKAAGTRSALCLPIVKQSKLLGLLYLENNLAPQIFTPERTDLLQLLSAQIVTSLENGLLFAGLHKEIEERKNAEDALRQSEQQYRAIFEMAAVGKSQLDCASLRFIKVNARYCEITGYSEAELLQMTPYDVTHPDDRDADFLNNSAMFKSTTTSEFEVEKRYLRKDGTTVWVQVNVAVDRDESGKAISTVAVTQDITSRVQAEAALKSLNQELEKRVNDRTADLAIAKEAAEAANRAKSEFVANMSHEIRTPMNSVIGMSDLLSRTPLNPEQKDFVYNIQNSAECLLDLINDILDFSKIEAGKLELSTTDFDLPSLIDNSVELLAGTARKKGLSLTSFVSPDIPALLHGDQPRIRQVLLNLLSNAIKFTTNGAVVVRVTAGQPVDNQVLLHFAIEDTGIGMTKITLDKLFSPFSQADSSITRKYGGTGLGLSISKRLVELMGGKIEVKSKAGEGSVFSFSIGLKVPPQPSTIHGARNRTDSCGEPLVSTSFGGAFILIAEDQKVNQKLAMLQLRELGCTSMAVCNGQEAVSAVEQVTYAAVLMDCQMPLMDGKEATRAIRKLEEASGKHVPIIAMTAQAMSGDREECLASGMDDYISKPVTSQKLEDVLKRWLPHFKTDAYAPQVVAAQPNAAIEKSSSTDFSIEQYNQKLSEWGSTFGNEVALELMREFIDGIQIVLAELEHHIADRNIDAVKMTTHRLKGLCLNFYRNEKSNLCLQLEHDAQANDWSSIQSHFLLLKDDFHEFLSLCKLI